MKMQAKALLKLNAAKVWQKLHLMQLSCFQIHISYRVLIYVTLHYCMHEFQHNFCYVRCTSAIQETNKIFTLLKGISYISSFFVSYKHLYRGGGWGFICFTYHAKQINLWPNLSASCVMIYLLVQGRLRHIKTIQALMNIQQASETSYNNSTLGNF